VLVRVVTRDDRRHVESAEQFVAKGAWVSHLVVAEMSWVLNSVYERTREQIATVIEMLLDHEKLTIQDPDVIEAALVRFRQNKRISFSNLLILEIARKNGHVPLGSFDRELAKLEGACRPFDKTESVHIRGKRGDYGRNI
jgi:predicted nucleic-acid-binding protein